MEIVTVCYGVPEKVDLDFSREDWPTVLRGVVSMPIVHEDSGNLIQLDENIVFVMEGLMADVLDPMRSVLDKEDYIKARDAVKDALIDRICGIIARHAGYVQTSEGYVYLGAI